MKLMKRLPKEDYDKMVAACDVGMIFLDHRFTIPNFPSRLLGYMQARKPILVATDLNTDIGKIVTEGGFGLSCYSDSVNQFEMLIERFVEQDIEAMGNLSWKFLCTNYDSTTSYSIIVKHFE